ncbi:MAG TPA: AMP-binding protein, partial [Pseudolabrys sp.]|nr:AMP-binding protein [Pseudolabrys sp.]
MLDRRPDGVIHLRTAQELGTYHRKLSEPLEHWAKAAPDRVFLAQCDGDGWRKLTYGQTLGQVRRIAAALLRRGLSADRPIVIMSGNDIEHALLGVAAMHVGIPYAPVSPAYSLMSGDFGKLKAIVDLLTPGLVFANSGEVFARA